MKLTLERVKKGIIFQIIPLLVIGYTLSVGLAILLWSNDIHSPSSGLAATNRMLNSFFSALLTSMALIITLTSNLYTARLSKIFVTHPLTVIGMGFILISNLLVMICNITSPENPHYHSLYLASFIISCLAIGGIIPYLYYVSQFIKPSYFLPLLKHQVLKKLNRIRKEAVPLEFKESCFESFEVLSNIAYTAAKRDDKHLIYMVFNRSYEIVNDLISNYEDEQSTWRLYEPSFIVGISQEARFYLEKEKEWPEAYFMGRLTKIVNNLNKQNNEIIPFYCEKLLETLDEAIDQNRETLIDLHLMTLNSLFNRAVEAKDNDRFQSISYYYRLAIELLINNPIHLKFAVESFFHYALQSHRHQLKNALETMFFDLGRIILYCAYEDEKLAINFVSKNILPLIEERVTEAEHQEVLLKTMAKTYWESASKGQKDLASHVFNTFIKDELKLRAATRPLLRYRRPLHREFNDRLLSFSYLTENALFLAEEFVHKEIAS